jgi:arylformamidase
LTSESAVACSPILQAAPKPPKMLVAAVGADESSEFVRQSKDICAVWSEAGITTECVIVPNANHFTVLDELTVPHSGMLNRLVEMAELRSRPG